MSKTSREFSRLLRKDQTAAEEKLWQDLRGRRCGGYKFRRQYIIDDYVVDFVCVSKKLVVEVDGPTHEGREDYDAERTEHIRKRGYRVIRFTNAEVLDETDAVVEGIFQELQI
jgi:very-short-patch-repair endonuclease